MCVCEEKEREKKSCVCVNQHIAQKGKELCVTCRSKRRTRESSPRICVCVCLHRDRRGTHRSGFLAGTQSDQCVCLDIRLYHSVEAVRSSLRTQFDQ